MTDDRTVDPTKPKEAPEHDLAPMAPAVKIGGSTEDLSIIGTKGKPVKIDLSAFQDPDKKHKRPTTFGEKAHWALTYIGGDWILNSAVGVTFTFLTSRTPWAEKYFLPKTNQIFSSVIEPFFKDPIKDQKIVKGAIAGCRDFLSIMVGGTVINPILTKLENHSHKKSISKFFDTVRYGKDRVEHDPKFQQAYGAIDREPLKDTRSVWYSRFIALAPLLALATIGSTRKFMESTDLPLIKHINFDSIARFSRKTADTLGIKPKGVMLEMVKDESRNKEVTRWTALHNIIGFDYGLTIFYALLHAVTFSAVARFRDNNRIKKTEQETPVLDGREAGHHVKPQHTPLISSPDFQVTQMAYEKPLAQPQQAAQLS